MGYKQARAWIELDLDNLLHNAAVLSAMLPTGCRLMPVVKADAYGHGAVPIARALEQAGIGAFCVATAAEGVALRRGGIGGEILVLGYTHPKEFDRLIGCQLTQTVVDYQYAEMLSGFGKPVRVHIAVDTGMHRLGERDTALERIAGIFRMQNLEVTGLFTHLCTDDSRRPEDKAFAGHQAESFQKLVQKLRDMGFSPRTHLLDSYGLLNLPAYGGDYARVGIALYGVLSSRQDRRDRPAELRPVLSVKARIAMTREVFAGEGLGYGLSYVADRDRRIAVLAIGYADGIPRSLSCGRGAVLIHGKRAPILGQICMDQMMVDVTDVPEAKSGEIAVLLGRSGSGEISVYQLAEACGTITNEVLSRLGARLPRVSLHGTGQKDKPV